MDVSFVTPLGALFVLTALLPFAVYAARQRRLGAIRKALGLDRGGTRSQLPFLLALAAVPVLLGVAAAQPVIERERTLRERTDAQVFVVVDVSRSMLASAERGAPTRFERARGVALGLSQALPEVPLGVATLTDRVLPHLFPTTDSQVYAATIGRAIDVEQPPPEAFSLTVATDLNGLRAVPEKNYFLPSAQRRVLVVLTDGETQPPEDGLAPAFARRPAVETVLVHFWDADERIFETGVAESGYRPDRTSAARLDLTARLVGGEVFGESEAAGATRAVRDAVGEGETIVRREGTRRVALMPWLTLAALVPLGLVLLRRNTWWRWPGLRERLGSRRGSHADPAGARGDVLEGGR
jgi:von Willebrand factor type A domain